MKIKQFMLLLSILMFSLVATSLVSAGTGTAFTVTANTPSSGGVINGTYYHTCTVVVTLGNFSGASAGGADRAENLSVRNLSVYLDLASRGTMRLNVTNTTNIVNNTAYTFAATEIDLNTTVTDNAAYSWKCVLITNETEGGSVGNCTTNSSTITYEFDNQAPTISSFLPSARSGSYPIVEITATDNGVDVGSSINCTANPNTNVSWAAASLQLNAFSSTFKSVENQLSWANTGVNTWYINCKDDHANVASEGYKMEIRRTTGQTAVLLDEISKGTGELQVQIEGLKGAGKGNIKLLIGISIVAVIAMMIIIFKYGSSGRRRKGKRRRRR